MKSKFTFRLSRLPYYLESLFCLFKVIPFQSWFDIFGWGMGRKIIHIDFPTRLRLRFHTWLDVLILKEVLLDKEYESGHVVVDRHDKVVVDVGAGMGEFALAIATAFPNVRVYAIEIDPVYIRLLQENIRSNNVSNVVVVKEKMRSLQDLLQITKEPIDFLKIDCEGCEYQFFPVKPQTLLKKIKKISMEYHEWTGKPKEIIVNALQAAGYHVAVSPTEATPQTGHIMAYQG